MNFFRTTVLSTLLLLSFTATAQQPPEAQPAQPSFQTFDDLDIHYSVFSSTSVQPRIAQQYGLVRGKDYVLVNVAVIEQDKPGKGLPATVSGAATNLMQQRKSLDFQTIAEQNTTYYIASLRVSNEEIFHFELQVDPEGERGPYTIKFTKKLYVNE